MDPGRMAELIDSNLLTPVVRVLHVDDDLSFLELTRQILLGVGGFVVDFALCVDEAFRLLSGGVYDVVVCDFEMPGKDGLVFLEELRAQKNLIPFILFTGKGREEVAINALNLGANYYLNKIGDTETVYGELVHAINNSIKSAKSEVALQNSEAKYRALINGMNDTVWVIDFDGNFLDVNDAAVRVLGYSREELLSMGISDIDYNLNPKKLLILVKNMPADKIQIFETIHTTKDGAKIYVEISSSLVNYNSTQAILSIARDITKRKQIEADYQNAINEAKRRALEVDAFLSSARAVLKNNEFSVIARQIFDSCKALTGALSGYVALLSEDGHENEVLFLDSGGLNCTVSPNLPMPIRGLREQAYLTCKSVYENDFFNSKWQKFLPNGHVNLKNVLFAPLVLDGKSVGLIGLANKQGGFTPKDAALAEAFGEYAAIALNNSHNLEKLRSNEERLNAIFEASKDAIIVVDTQGMVNYVNKAALELFDFESNILGAPLFSTIHQQYNMDQNKFSLALQTFFNNKDNSPNILEVPFKKCNGAERTVELSFSSFNDGNKTFGVAIVRDITKRKSVEIALADSEAKYRALVENADDAIILTDINGKTLFKNSAYFINLGFEEAEAVEAESFAKIHPDDLQSVRAKSKELFHNGCSTFEYRIQHRNGSWVHRHARSTLIFNVANQPYAVLSVIRDISDRIKAEEKIKEDAQRIELMNEKLRVVGSLTRHDVANKLSTITGYSYLLKKRYAGHNDIVEALCKMERAVRDSTAIFEFAKRYEQLGAEKLTYLDVQKTVYGAIGLLSDISFKVIVSCQGLNLLADSFLHQLFYNLIDNTRKHGQKVTTVNLYLEQPSPDKLELIYEDDGVGISAENKYSIFKEGFSTAGSTGFGLFLIRKMMDVYGWAITEEGTAGKGARFVITIPKINNKGMINFHISK